MGDCRLGSMNDIRSDGEIVVQELRRPPVIGGNAANLSRGHKNGLRPCLFHPRLNCRLAREVELRARDGENGTIDLRQASKQCRTDHALVARDPQAFASEAVDRLDFSHVNSQL